MSEYLLKLNQFAVAIGNHSLLNAVTLNLPRTGITCLVGANGTGKATLIRALCGLYDTTANIRMTGEALYLGQPLGAGSRPAMAVTTPKLHLASLLENMLEAPLASDPDARQRQREQAAEQLAIGGLDSVAHLLDEPMRYLPTAVQRYASIVRLVQKGSALICLNEPLLGLDSTSNRELLALIDCIGASRAVLLTVSEENRDAIPSHWRVIDMAESGALITSAEGEFPAPPPHHTIPCAGPLLANSPLEVATDPAAPVATAPAAQPKPEAVKPPAEVAYCGQFRWLSPGRLAGCLVNLDHDLPGIAAQLQAKGADNLLLLVDNVPDAEVVDNAPLHCSIHSVPDVMHLTLDVLSTLCQKIEDLIRERGSVAVCGEPGSGKTAALLAAYLIWEGMTAEEARRTLTKMEPEWIGGEEVDWEELWQLLDNFSWS